jgi:hypothetical protein
MDAGSRTQKFWQRFWMKSSMIGGGRAVPFFFFFNFTMSFAFQLQEITENLSQGSRVDSHNLLCRHGRLFRDSLGWPAEHQSTSVTRL